MRKLTKRIGLISILATFLISLPTIYSQFISMRKLNPDQTKSFRTIRGISECVRYATCHGWAIILLPYFVSGIASDFVLLPVTLFLDAADLVYYKPQYLEWKRSADNICEMKSFFDPDNIRLNKAMYQYYPRGLGVPYSEFLTLPMIAVICDNRTVLQQALKNDFDINFKHPDGWSALMYAAWSRNIYMTKILIENGADPLQIDPDGRNIHDIAKLQQSNTGRKEMLLYIEAILQKQ